MLQKIKSVAKFVLPALLVGFILSNIYQNRNLVITSWHDFEIFPLLISLIFMLLIYFEAAFNYHILIKTLGFPLKFSQSLYIFIVSNASRYIPGIVWQYIGRIELANNIGRLPRKVSVLELVLEVFLLVNAAVIVSLIALPFFRDFTQGNFLLIFLIPLSLIFLHPKVAGRLLALIALVGKKDIDKSILDHKFKKIILTLPWFILNFLFNGIALFFLVRAIFPEIGIENIILFSGAFAFSWALGYLSFFAPAGLGVMDVSLAYLLSLQMPFAIASTIALSYRVLLTIAELIIFLFVIKNKPGQSDVSMQKITIAWEERSKKFGYKPEGVATKSLPPLVNKKLDQWMFTNIKASIDLKSNKNIKVLDLGCGYGRLSRQLLKRFSNVRTFGIDISKNYVKLYNQSLNPRGKGIKGDIRKLPFADDYFNMAFMVTTLMYLTKIEDQEKCLKEIIRVLKPGGQVIIIERNPSGYYLFTFGGLINLIRGKRNKEISAISIEKKALGKIIYQAGGELTGISGIPFLSLFIPYSVLLYMASPKLLGVILKPINYIDNNFKSLLWPSLYLSYTVLKPRPKK